MFVFKDKGWAGTMRIRQFEQELSQLSAWSRAEIEQRTRGLRESDRLPVGGRGLNAPAMEPAHAAAILIAAAVAQSASDSPVAVDRYGAMKPIDKVDGHTFYEVLTAILSDPTDKLDLQHVTICRSWPEAEIRFGQHAVIYRATDLPTQGYGFPIRVDVTFSGGVLQYLAMEIDSEHEEED